MVIPKCCIPGCSYEGPERYRFPNPKKELIMLQRWILLIGGALTAMDAEHIYNSKRICKNHFEKEYQNPGRKGLLRTAIPTLFLEPCRTMQNLECVEAGPSRVTKKNVTQQICEADAYQLMKDNFLKSSQKEDIACSTLQTIECMDAGPSYISEENTHIPQMCTVQSCETGVCEKSPERRDTVTRVQLLQNIGVTRSIELTPRKKLLYGDHRSFKTVHIL